MEPNSIHYLLLGSTFGLVLRILLTKGFTVQRFFLFDNISLVNFLASFLLGIFIVINPIRYNLFVLIYVGFLGCFSTFSSFIYQLFSLIQGKQYINFLINYFGLLVFSFLFFYLGYYLTQIFK